MIVTKEQIKEMNIRQYYIVMDGMNNDKIGRCTTMEEVKEIARTYDNECDGEWLPILISWNKDNEKGKRGLVIDDWCY